MEGVHVIDVNDLVNSMTRKLKHGSLGVINQKKVGFSMIHKLRRMPNADEDVHEPTAVSIGPYHYKINTTLDMERRKWESFKYILQLNPEKKMRDYLEAMAGLEQQIRSCYADEVKIGSDEFIKMMLLDGCFLLYTLHGLEGATETNSKFKMDNTNDRTRGFVHNGNEAGICNKMNGTQQTPSCISEQSGSPDNSNYMEQWNASFLMHDLLLLENQIPFLVVMKIFVLVTNGNTPITVLVRNISMFIEDVLQPYPKSILDFDETIEFHNLLHLCHLYFKPNLSTSENDDPGGVNILERKLLGWHSASEYHKAGVILMTREFRIEDPHYLLDIRLCEGVIEIPCLTIDTNTHCLFRNLIAFEETCPQFGNYITAYVVFLSQFASMPEDVSLLTKTGIIVHQLDSDGEVSDLFKMVAKAVSFDFNIDHYLKHGCYELEVHYQMQRPTWREWLGSISSTFHGWPHESKPDQLCTRSSSPEEFV